MAKLKSQERRKQILKQRRAEERREADREELGFLFAAALDANRRGDAPAADRLLKQALSLDPDHEGALSLLAQIHDGAGHHAEALAYLRRLRKLKDDPVVLYNIGVVYRRMGQPENAFDSMRGFLSASQALREPKWQRLRESAEALCRDARLRTQLKKPAPPYGAAMGERQHQAARVSDRGRRGGVHIAAKFSS
jgi:predicted Zn-dependent protease